jgi:hypothetical protein
MVNSNDKETLMIEKIDSSYPLLPLISFCSKSLDDSRPNAINMDPIDWKNKPHTFLYLLYIEKRFDGPRAGYLVYHDKEEIVAGAGWYSSDWDTNIFVASRMYTIPGQLKGLSLKDANSTNDLVYSLEDFCIKDGYLGGCHTTELYNEHLVDRSIKINDKSRYPDYHNVTETISGRTLITKEFRKANVRMRSLKKIGPYLIKNTNQLIFYSLYDPTYEEEFLEKLNTCQS